MSALPLSWVQPITSGTVDVVVTPLVAASDFSGFEALMFVAINDGAFPFDMLVETGEAAGVWDGGAVWMLTVPAGAQRTVEIPQNLRRLYRMSATASGGATAARWAVRGVRRLGGTAMNGPT